MALTKPPFGVYATVAGVVGTTAAAQIQTAINVLDALIPSGAEGSSPTVHPDFDKMPVELGVKLKAEIVALKAAIAAAPTS